MVNPYGFQFKGGRIVKDGDANLGTAATPDGKDKGADAGNGNGNHGENGMNGDDGTIDPSKIEKKQPATATATTVENDVGAKSLFPVAPNSHKPLHKPIIIP